MPKRILIPAIIILMLLLGGLLIVSVRTGIPQGFWGAQDQREDSILEPKPAKKEPPSAQQKEIVNPFPQPKEAQDVDDKPDDQQIPAGSKAKAGKKTIPKTASSFQLPSMIRLRYRGEIYDGLEGSSCWFQVNPDGSLGPGLCEDTEFVDPPNAIPVVAGDTLTVEIEANEAPLSLTAAIYTATRQLKQTVTLTPNLTTSFVVDLPTGVYIIHISGQWQEGDVYYGFKIKVN